MECQTNFLVKLVKKMMKKGSRTFRVKESAEAEYIQAIDEAFASTVIGNEDCGNWFLNERGVVTIPFPGTGVEFWKKTRNVQTNKFDFM